jgi:predicted small lipoprotein YifL
VKAITLAAILAAMSVAACGSAGPHAMAPPPMTSHVAVTVTETDSGRTIRLSPGQAVAVVLSPRGMFSWHVPAEAGAAVRRTSAADGYPGQRPARATFLATRRGSATLSATDDTACLHAQPACSVAQRTWQVTVLVG